MMKMSDVLIIGNGPAGISAALYAARAGLKTTVIGKDYGSLAKAGEIENYYGFENPIKGTTLIADGIAQAKRVGVNIIIDEVMGIGYGDKLFAKTKDNEYLSESIIITTGSSRSAPKIDGIDKFEGSGISYCAVCDAFFYRGKDVAVLGGGEYALHEANELLPVVKSVTILSNGEEPASTIPDSMAVIQKKISAFEGNETLQTVRFADGTSFAVEGVFVAFGVAGSSELAKGLGAQTAGTKIVVDENMATNVPGLFAAGDCTGGMLQISKAVYEGAKAATEAIKFVRKNKSK